MAVVDLGVEICGLKLKNPVMSASGTFGYGGEYARFVPPEVLGAIVTKGISLEPRSGNPPPRIVETPAGMMNAIGLENVGLEGFIKNKLPYLKDRGAVVVANILGESVDEYAAIAKGLSEAGGVAMLEVNVSCPNVAAGGFSFGTDPVSTEDVTRAVVDASGGLPVMVKLTPMVTDITAVAKAAVRGGAGAISLINTIPAMAVDLDTGRPKLANVIGDCRSCHKTGGSASGLAGGRRGGGACNRHRRDHDRPRRFGIHPGGCNRRTDRHSQFRNPKAALDVIDGIGEYLHESGFGGVAEIRGRLKNT